MRPLNMTVTELIEQYTKEDKLHVLEIATALGAMQEYQLRSYTEKVSINSFPTETFSEEEGLAFRNYYGDLTGIEMVEILEYPCFSEEICKIKKTICKEQNITISIDDFG